MKHQQTDNTYFNSKVALRERYLPVKDCIHVLDVFAGTGRLWDAVASRSDKKIVRLSIDKRPLPNIDLVGDNRKILPGLDMNKYDVIDLDAYGYPVDQLSIVLDRAKKGTVIFVTAIQIMQGGLPYKLLYRLGYTHAMIRKIPTLFMRRGMDKLKQFLGTYSVGSIDIMSEGRYNYFVFTL